MATLEILNDAGGLRYHLRALKNRQKWLGFRRQVSTWIQSWEPKEKNLIWVGPSGSYCLDIEWMSRFRKIIAFEIDPIARMILKSKTRHLPISICAQSFFDFWISQNFESQSVSLFQGEPFCILFSNFLGQVETVYPSQRKMGWPTATEWLRRTRESIDDLSFATFHDRFSSSLVPTNWDMQESATRIDSEQLVELFYSNSNPQNLKNAEITEHDLEVFWKENDRGFRYWVWPLNPPKNYHLIEGFYK